MASGSKSGARKAATRKASTRKAGSGSKTAAKKLSTKKAPARKSAAKTSGARKAGTSGKTSGGKAGSRSKAVAKGPRIPLYNETEVGPDELEFIEALNAYKEDHGRLFPKQSEILHVLRHLGYRKVGGAGS